MSTNTYLVLTPNINNHAPLAGESQTDLRLRDLGTNQLIANNTFIVRDDYNFGLQ